MKSEFFLVAILLGYLGTLAYVYSSYGQPELPQYFENLKLSLYERFSLATAFWGSVLLFVNIMRVGHQNKLTKEQIQQTQEHKDQDRFNDALGKLKEDETNNLQNYASIRTLVDLAVRNPKEYYLTVVEVVRVFLTADRKTCLDRNDIQYFLDFIGNRHNEFVEEKPNPLYSVEFKTLESSLRRLNLMDVQLPHASLWEADLEKVDFSGANLTGANLTGANLKNVILCDTNVKEAHLYRADISKTNFKYIKNHTDQQLIGTYFLESESPTYLDITSLECEPMPLTKNEYEELCKLKRKSPDWKILFEKLQEKNEYGKWHPEYKDPNENPNKKS